MTSHRKIVCLLIAFAHMCVLSSSLSAEDKVKAPSVQQIIENSNRVAYYQGKDGRAKVTMTITDSQGRTRKRKFTILRQDEPQKRKDEDKEAKEHSSKVEQEVGKKAKQESTKTGQDEDKKKGLMHLQV